MAMTNEQLRSASEALVARLNSDAAFKEKVLQDPVAALKAEGLPEPYISDLARQVEDADVKGYCWCIFSTCAITDVHTIIV